MLLIEGDVFILDCACFLIMDGDINFQECLWHNNIIAAAFLYVCRHNVIFCCSLASHEDWLGNHTLTNMPHVCM